MKGGPFGNVLRSDLDATDADIGLLLAISEPIVSASFLPGSSIRWGMEVAAQTLDAELHWHAHVYVVQGESDVVRCTLLDNYEESVSTGNAWPTIPIGIGPQPTSPGLDDCSGASAPQPGDRLAIEVGFASQNTSAGSRWGFLNYGTTNADVVLGAGGGAPWVDLMGAQVTFTTNATLSPAATATATLPPSPSASATRTLTPLPSATNPPLATLTRTATRTASPTVTIPVSSPTPSYSATPSSTSPPATPTHTATVIPSSTVSASTPTPIPTAQASTPSSTPDGGGVRLYLTSEAPSYAPTATYGTWWRPPLSTVKLSPSKGGVLGNSLRQGRDTAIDIGLLVAISEPMAAAEFPSGSRLNWAIEAAEQANDADMYWHLHVYVLDGTTDTIRCTLLADYREDPTSNNEWSTLALGRGPRPAPPFLIACAATPPQPGDRLVVEIGYIARNQLSAWRYGFINYGTTQADVVEGASGGAPWLEFIGARIEF